MFKKLVKPIQTVTIQNQDIDLYGLTMEDIAEVIEALPEDVLNMFGDGRDLSIVKLVTKFPKVAALLLVKSANVPKEDVSESLEAIASMGFAHKVMCLKAVWDLTVPDDEAFEALKNVGRSLYKQTQTLGAMPQETGIKIPETKQAPQPATGPTVGQIPDALRP